MAHDESQAAGPTKLVIRNIGLLLSGAMEKPILDADTILAENGKITAIGRAGDIDAEGATTIRPSPPMPVWRSLTSLARAGRSAGRVAFQPSR